MKRFMISYFRLKITTLFASQVVEQTQILMKSSKDKVLGINDFRKTYCFGVFVVTLERVRTKKNEKSVLDSFNLKLSKQIKNALGSVTIQQTITCSNQQ